MERGALTAAPTAAEAGWRPIYVGANLPAEELASAVVHFDARCIGLSISHLMDDNRLRQERLKLKRYLGADRHILIGGLHCAGLDDLLDRLKAHRSDSWPELVKTLGLLAIE